MAEKKDSTINDKKVLKPKKVIDKKVEVKKVKPKFVKKKYKLIKDVSIDGKVNKKGSTIELTDKGRQYFKQQFYIK